MTQPKILPVHSLIESSSLTNDFTSCHLLYGTLHRLVALLLVVKRIFLRIIPFGQKLFIIPGYGRPCGAGKITLLMQ
jgi:hypothetical protein